MNDLKKFGFLIVKNRTIRAQAKKAYALFKNSFERKFSNSPVINREIIKRFADHPLISSIYTSRTMVKILKDLGCKYL